MPSAPSSGMGLLLAALICATVLAGVFAFATPSAAPAPDADALERHSVGASPVAGWAQAPVLALLVLGSASCLVLAVTLRHMRRA